MTPDVRLRVTAVHVYPVKGCAGASLASARVSARGFAGDRDFMLVDGAGSFVTQREHPRLAIVRPRIEGDLIHLDAPGCARLAVGITHRGPARIVRVWRDTCRAIDQGDAAAAWFSAYLESDCRLVRVDETVVRGVDARYARRATDQAGFADGYPFLVISEESLAALNERMAVPLPMDRFRPSIVVSGGDPFVEDGITRFRIGPVTFDVVKPCTRCVVTTVDQRTGATGGHEPLRTLATFRRHPRKEGVMFGQNLVHEGEGVISIGDEVDVLAASAGVLATG